jgi:hypothetical protein
MLQIGARKEVPLVASPLLVEAFQRLRMTAETIRPAAVK